MKIVTVVGARPQFIKAAALSRVLRREHEEVLVHTGQHHDSQMSDVFFQELSIPKPNYNLGIAGGSHAQMTARMLMAVEEVLLAEKPDALLVYGDTNSTLAAALAAVKLHIPILHVEAGNRLGSLVNPEEVNRVLTDHISTALFACVPSSVAALARENLTQNVHLVGDPMYDAFLYYVKRQKNRILFFLPGLAGGQVPVPTDFAYLTCHREENTRTEEALSEILLAMESLPYPTLYPVHPRNKESALHLVHALGLRQVQLVEPLGYLDSIWLCSRARQVVTDSGGVQREAFFARVPCVTVFDYPAWPETLVGNGNQLAKPDREDIRTKWLVQPCWDITGTPFGDGHACEKICAVLQGLEL